MVRGHRSGDRNHLLHTKTELSKRTTDVDRQAVALQRRGRLAMHPVEVDQSQPVEGLAPQEQVPCDAQQWDQVHFLVDRADSCGLGVQWPSEGHRHAAVDDLTVVGLVDTGQDLDQGGLAGTVLPDERMDLAGAEPRETSSSATTPENRFETWSTSRTKVWGGGGGHDCLIGGWCRNPDRPA